MWTRDSITDENGLLNVLGSLDVGWELDVCYFVIFVIILFIIGMLIVGMERLVWR